MVKEVAVHVWCDVCMAEETQTPAATTPPITLGQAKPRTLDLCEPHRKEFLDPLHDLLMAEGAVADATHAQLGAQRRHQSGPSKTGVNATPGPFDCKAPGCSGRNSFRNNGPGYPYLGALKSHITYQHGLTFPEYVEAHGDPVPEVAPVPPSGPRKSRGSQRVEVVEDLPDPGENYTCGIDGCEASYPLSEYNMPAQALGLHRASQHGVKAPPRRRGKVSA